MSASIRNLLQLLFMSFLDNQNILSVTVYGNTKECRKHILKVSVTCVFLVRSHSKVLKMAYASSNSLTNFNPDSCIFCHTLTLLSNPSEKLSTVRPDDTGMETIKNVCNTKKEFLLLKYLSSNPDKVLAHSTCRKRFTYVSQSMKRKEREEKEMTEEGQKRKTRSETGCFRWKDMCFLCAKPVNESDDDLRRAQTMELKNTILFECNERKCNDKNDEWGLQVAGRLALCTDLTAFDGVYHANCRKRFNKRLEEIPTFSKIGRAPDVVKMRAFNRLCEHLEAGCENNMYTLAECHTLMTSFVDGDEVFGAKHMQNLLKNRYGDGLTFADRQGKRTVLCFRDTTKSILNQEWYDSRNANIDSDNERIVQTAARLIAGQIRDLPKNQDEYPTDADIVSLDSPVVPHLLITCRKSFFFQWQATGSFGR